jgi:hypothetical protein
MVERETSGHMTADHGQYAFAGRARDEGCNVGAGAFAASVCAWPGVLIMSVYVPITIADCRTKREVLHIGPFPDGIVICGHPIIAVGA